MLVARHRASGQHNGDPVESAEEFWTNFARGDLISFYAFIAWKGLPLNFLSRLLPESMNGVEEGVENNRSDNYDSSDRLQNIKVSGNGNTTRGNT